jgi:hypothetical protein
MVYNHNVDSLKKNLIQAPWLYYRNIYFRVQILQKSKGSNYILCCVCIFQMIPHVLKVGSNHGRTVGGGQFKRGFMVSACNVPGSQAA